MNTLRCYQQPKVMLIIGMLLLFFCYTHSSYALTTGGGLPFDDWLTKLKNSMTGPFAFTAAILGLIGAGSALIFGGEINGFLKSIIFMILVLSLLVTAENFLSVVTGKSAEISPILSKNSVIEVLS